MNRDLLYKNILMIKEDIEETWCPHKNVFDFFSEIVTRHFWEAKTVAEKVACISTLEATDIEVFGPEAEDLKMVNLWLPPTDSCVLSAKGVERRWNHHRAFEFKIKSECDWNGEAFENYAIHLIKFNPFVGVRILKNVKKEWKP